VDNVAAVGDRQCECNLPGDVEGPADGQATSGSDQLGHIGAVDKFERDVELAIY